MPCSSALLRHAECCPWGHTVVFVDSAYLASRLRSVSDAPVRRLRSWQQSNTESLIELLASVGSAEKLRAKPAMGSQLCLDLPQGRVLVDQPLSPLVISLPCLLSGLAPLQLNGAQSLYARHCPRFCVCGVTRWDARDELGREVLVMPTDQTKYLSV
jgi:hypothetical protein